MKTKYHRKAAIRARMESLKSSGPEEAKRPTDLELFELVQNGRMAIQTLLVSRSHPEFQRFADVGIESLWSAEREILRRLAESRKPKSIDVDQFIADLRSAGMDAWDGVENIDEAIGRGEE